jgi:hypothetical protein
MEIFNKKVSILGELTLSAQNAAGEILTLDNTGVVRKRSKAETLQDINAYSADNPEGYISQAPASLIEVDTFSLLPQPGTEGVIYITTDDNEQFRWKTNTYIISSPKDKTYTHNQGTPSAIWNISHGLNKKASVMVVDTANTVVIGKIDYVDDNNITLTFNGSFSGYAYIN